jgi:hypothetical protein
LLFIRLLQESGVTVFSDPDIQLNLLYDWERDQHFKKLKQKVEVQRKKGPRQILNPDLKTVDFKVDMGSHHFDRHEFNQ